MEFLVIFQVLRRGLGLVVLGALVAVATSLLFGYHVSLSPLKLTSREGVSGVASARALVDTTVSQVVGSAPKGSESLMEQASVLTNALATPDGTAVVARNAGLPARKLVVYDPEQLVPTVASPLALGASAAAQPATPFALAVQLDRLLPIVSLQATAPDVAGATRLVDSAVEGMRQVARQSGNRSVLAIERIAPTRGKKAVNGPGPPLVAMTMVVVFAAWCSLLVIASGFLRVRRRSAGRPQPAA